MGDEIRRIYEKGGEVRSLAGESISRIFMKGKYYPGLLNTRSLGDLVGRDIGVISEPHFAKYSCDEKLNYYIILCTDGISNSVSVDKMISIIESNDLRIFFFTKKNFIKFFSIKKCLWKVLGLLFLQRNRTTGI